MTFRRYNDMTPGLVRKREKILVETRVSGELRVKRSGKEMALLRRHDFLVGGGSQRFRAIAYRLDDRRPDEDRMVRPILAGRRLQLRDIQVSFERVDLATEGIA